jgi:predicted SprT family Zn-dependent metalloprotease
MSYKLLILIILVLFFGFLHFYFSSETKWIQSDIDNHYYLVKNNKLDKLELKKSANVLGEINKRIEKLIQRVNSRYPKLSEMYHRVNLSEAAIDTRYTTFTVDKRDIHVCLRTRNDSQQLYDIDRLMYVVIHELAHMANWDRKTGQPIIGHGKEFIQIFKDLLKESIRLGIYNYIDYSKNPKEYCGIVITSNVLSPNEI